jgi:diguanylate cyclase (GGDEF)-like protein
MPKVPGQIWLVSLAVVVVSIMAAAAPHAAPNVVGQVASTVNRPLGSATLSLSARDLAATVALIIAGLLMLVFLYRRRVFILIWTGGWTTIAASMFLAGQDYRSPALAWICYGLSQFLSVVSALIFVLAADAYRNPRFRRDYVATLVPVLLWFALAPVFLGYTSVFAPGHLMVAGALAAAGIGHLLLIRQVPLLGAAVTGIGFLALAVVNVWVAIELPSPEVEGLTTALLVSIVLYLVTAGGMQLMTFEDMTYELRRTNKRLENAQSKLRRAVITDPLTGCRNRRFFDEVIGRELQRHRRYGIPLSLLFVDIDRFKAINDTYGHDVGDEVLRQVASFLLSNIREADYVFRWGGDEFLVLISCTEAEARKRATALETAFMGSSDVLEMPAEIRLSIGCAEVRNDSDDVMSLLKVADGRMYENKRQAAAS